MERVKRLVGFRVTRFLLAGAVNTAVNFAVLNLAFYGLHQNKLVASLIATLCAVLCSFALNRSYVFMDKERPARKFGLFVLVTAGGVLLIQNSVYTLCVALFHNHEAGVIASIHTVATLHFSPDFVDVNLSNLIASFVVMFWNYNGYKLFVFEGTKHSNDITEELSTETA